MSLQPLFIAAADAPGLGRFTSDFSTQQSLMELVIENTRLAWSNWRDENGNYNDMCEWAGVTCNEDGDVININWGVKNFLDEQPKLQWLPSTVQSILLYNSRQKGSLDAAKLPKDLRRGSFSGNDYEGSFDFSSLPPGLKSLDLNDNRLTGSVDLKCLPEPMTVLLLLRNHFSGSIELDGLPKGMQMLNIAENSLTGEFTLKNLPQALEVLQLNDNAFEFEEVVAVALPPTLKCLDLRNNDIARIVDEKGEEVTRDFLHLGEQEYLDDLL